MATNKSPMSPMTPISPSAFRTRNDPDDAREREVHKYYRAFDRLYNATQHTTPACSDASSVPLAEILSSDTAKLRSSPDCALTAFAQLGCHRLNCRRVLISLLDCQSQYVIAEATRTSSLSNNIVVDGEEGLRFGVNEFARAGTAPCEYTVGLVPLMPGSPETLSVDQIFVVPDLSLDDRFCQEPYVCNVPNARFYAGAPIVSSDGHTIGAYYVLDDKPRAELSAPEIAFVRDMAATVMSHLEMLHTATELRRSRDMVTGLGNFISGGPTTKNWWRIKNMRTEKKARRDELSITTARGRSRVVSLSNSSGAPMSASRHRSHSRSTPDSVSEAEEQSGPPPKPSLGPDDTVEIPPASPSQPLKDPVQEAKTSSSHHLQRESVATDIRETLQRAAEIVRNALDIDGAVFLDASIGTFGGLVQKPRRTSTTNQPSASPPITELETSGENFISAEDKPCLVLGTSLATGEEFTDHEPLTPGSIPESLLKSLLAKYPKGKIWNYEEGETLKKVEYDASTPMKGSHYDVSRKGRRWRERKLIQALFPGVRSLAFIGMWDINRERWYAGSMLWTCSPARVLSMEIELNYLLTVGHSIMSEVAASDIRLADSAKSTFISSISHELRTPLHGILGSADCIQSTALNALQSDLVDTIDTCGKTLLDVFDNLLSYAKINYMTGMKRKDDVPKTGVMGPENDIAFDSLVEEVVDTVFSGQEYLRTGPVQPHDGDIGGLVGLASRENTSKRISKGVPHPLDAVSVSVSCNNAGSSQWVFHTQAGAWRRIILNLFGNALKYTERGFVHVNLQAAPTPGDEDNSSDITVLVSDSGKGMSDEFAQNKLFAPFIQEDPLSPGTGLGMSIVKKIVEEIHGRISVTSKQGEGTEVTCTITLPHGTKTSQTSLVHTIREKTQGSRMCVLPNAITQSGLNDAVWTFAHICRESFGLSVDFAPKGREAGLYVTSEKHIRALAGKISSLFPESNQTTRRALIVLCKDSASMRGFRNLEYTTPWFPMISCFAQPVGPTKIAKALAPCIDYLRGSLAATHPPQQSPIELSSNETRIFPAGSRVSDTSITTNTAVQSSTPASPKEAESLNPSMSVYEDTSSSPQPEKSNVLWNVTEPPGQDVTTSDVIEGFLRPTQHVSSRSFDFGQVTADAIQSKDSDNAQPPHAMSAPLPEATPRSSVLLVDDNVINLRLLATFMRKLNRVYSLAENGMEAFETYQAAIPSVVAESKSLSNDFPAFDFVFMDLNMPVLDGLQCTRRIRALEHKLGLRAAKIMALTGMASAQIQQEAFASGVDVFLTKPVRLKEIAHVLEEEAGTIHGPARQSSGV